MSTQILSTVVPDTLASRVRDLAAAEDRPVSAVLRRLLTSALENANGPAANGAVAKHGESAPDVCAD